MYVIPTIYIPVPILRILCKEYFHCSLFTKLYENLLWKVSMLYSTRQTTAICQYHGSFIVVYIWILMLFIDVMVAYTKENKKQLQLFIVPPHWARRIILSYHSCTPLCEYSHPSRNDKAQSQLIQKKNEQLPLCVSTLIKV